MRSFIHSEQFVERTIYTTLFAKWQEYKRRMSNQIEALEAVARWSVIGKVGLVSFQVAFKAVG